MAKSMKKESVMVEEVAPVVAVQVDEKGLKTIVGLSMEEFDARGWKTTSAAIRGLAADGYSRSAIAKYLDIRYQHVRNVLTTELKRPSTPPVAKAE